jgi:mannose-6-phosphate isomerase-like protein (cupin superfamily)
MTNNSHPSGVRIYKAADAPTLGEAEFGSRTDYSEHEELRPIAAALGKFRCNRLLVNQEPDDGGFSLAYFFFKPNFPLFRHRHEDDCMYFIISGSAVMGSQVLRAGDSFFVPSMAPYMYTAGSEGIEVLEIRHNADAKLGYTTIFARNQPARLEEAQTAIDENGALWESLTEGPLFQDS